MRQRGHWWRRVLRLLGPALLVVVIWQLEQKEALWAAFARVQWLPLAAAVALNAPVIHLKVWRWRALLRARGHEYPLGRCYLAVLSSLYLGMLTPGRVGDALRIQYLKHDVGTPYAEGLAVTVMDRLCDLYALAAFVALGIVHFAASLRADLAALSWAAVALSVLGPLVLLLPAPARLLLRVLERLVKRWQTSAETLLVALRALVRPGITVGMPPTVIAYLLNFVQGWLIAAALGFALSFRDAAALVAITALLGLMPVSISGVGVRELFLALVFPDLGLAPADGVAFGLLVFGCVYLTTVAVGFVAWQLAPPPMARDADLAAPVHDG